MTCDSTRNRDAMLIIHQQMSMMMRLMRTSRLTFALIVVVLAAQSVLEIRQNIPISPWMRQFMLLLVLTAIVSVVTMISDRIRLYLIPAVALLISIASVPFGDDVALRLMLVTMIGIVAATSNSVLVVLATMSFHAFWIVAMMRVRTPFPDASGQTSLATVVVLIGWSVMITLVAERGVSHARELKSAKDHILQAESAVRVLSEANVGYRDFARLARHQALLEERNRITREIHDDIAYTLTNITMLCETAISLLTPSYRKPIAVVETIRHQAQTGLYETRKALRLLRTAGHDLPTGLDALKEIIDVYQRATGVMVEFRLSAHKNRVDNSQVFPLIYHFVQECLTNAFRHGNATNVDVHILEDGDWLIVTAADDGNAKSEVSEGIGLQGMRERIHELGGTLTYFQRGGFVVTARIPLVPQDPVPRSVR